LMPPHPLVFTPLCSFAAIALGCATLAQPAGGQQQPPNAQAGPFRLIRSEELGNGRVAPYAIDDSDHFTQAAAVVDADSDSATTDVWGYFAANYAGDAGAPSPEAPNAIVRCGAKDGRSFDRTVVTVLQATETWEAGRAFAPAVVRAGTSIFLFYA